MSINELEERTRRFGHEIFARLDRQGPILFTRAWFENLLMTLGMDHPVLKVQLFRFIDTLPYLNDDREVSRHLKEYLLEVRHDLPGWIRHSLRLIPHEGLLAKCLATFARFNATQMAHKFIAGSNIHEALHAIHRLRARRLAFTIDLLGEATITEAEAEAVQQQYLELLAGLSPEINAWTTIPEIDQDDRGPIPRVNVSVKLSALYSQFDPIDPEGTSRAVSQRLRPILDMAKSAGAFVNFDMEQYSFKDTTLRIFQEILGSSEFRNWPHVGIAIQAYLRDSESDLKRLLAWAQYERGCPVVVRLVKGAYWDYETVIAAQNGWPVPVFTQKWESDANFEKLADLLLANSQWLVPAFGSHNIRSIAHCMASAERHGIPKHRFEFQMLYGMADTIKDAIQSMGYRVRIYTPYGQLLPGMAYLVRRLLENSSNDSFLRQGFASQVSEDILLRDPRESIIPNSSAIESQRQSTQERNAMTQVTPVTGSQQHQQSCGSTRHVFHNEPLLDFAKDDHRGAMQQGLSSVRGQLGQTYPAVVDGKPLPVVRTFESINPSSKAEVIGRVAASTPEQANISVAAAAHAFETWRDTPVHVRADFLRSLAQQFRRRRCELAAWIILETGKPWREADADVAEAIDFCEYYAHEAERLMQHPIDRDYPGEDNRYFYEPRGVTVIIAPWNFPLAILTGMTVAALATGNTTVMKPAEQSSVVAAKLMDCFLAAGLPRGVVNLLPGIGEEIGPILVNHPDVAIIAFTGSLKVALVINEQAARTPLQSTHVKRVIAEMGGKNAIIVDSDADLDEAVRGVVDSAFGYSGQKCSAASRAIVIDGIYDQFLNRLIEATKSLTIAPADQPGASLGPVIDEDAYQRIQRAIEQGQSEARLVHRTDVGELVTQGFFVGPTIFADVPESASIAQEEIFGPVLCVMRAKNLDDAIRIANGTKYALTGGVFSRSPSHIAEVKRRFRVGNLYINRKCTGALVDRQPFGGFKLSGIGSKAGGPDYLLQFVLPRTITENQLRRGFAPEIGSMD